MKKNKLILIFLLTLNFISQVVATDLSKAHLRELKSISKIKGNGSNKLYTLIGQTAEELQKNWSAELAKELARVYNELLNVNQNFFLIELIQPLLEKEEKRFRPIFEEALSKENLKHYQEMLEMDKREEREGNG